MFPVLLYVPGRELFKCLSVQVCVLDKRLLTLDLFIKLSLRVTSLECLLTPLRFFLFLTFPGIRNIWSFDDQWSSSRYLYFTSLENEIQPEIQSPLDTDERSCLLSLLPCGQDLSRLGREPRITGVYNLQDIVLVRTCDFFTRCRKKLLTSLKPTRSIEYEH